MTAALAYLPDDHQEFALARMAFRQPDLTDEQLDAAIDVLSASNDWMDCLLVREARKAVELRKVQAVFRAAPQDETPMEVAMQHKDRWPEILIYAAIGAVVILAWVGWI